MSLETRAGEEDGASQATPRGFVLRAADDADDGGVYEFGYSVLAR